MLTHNHIRISVRIHLQSHASYRETSVQVTLSLSPSSHSHTIPPSSLSLSLTPTDLCGICCGHYLMPFWTFFGATFIGKAVIRNLYQSLVYVTLCRYGTVQYASIE